MKKLILMITAAIMTLSLNAQLKHSGNILLTTLGETKSDTLLSTLIKKVGDRSKEVGAELNFESGKLNSFTFYNVPMDGYQVYDDAWPFGLDSSKSKGLIQFAFSQPGEEMQSGDVLNYSVPGVDIELTFQGELLAKGTFTWAADYKSADKVVKKPEIDGYLTDLASNRIYSKSGDCVEGDCQDGEGKLEMKNGLVYSGEWENFYAHGSGKVEFPKGGYYDGTFELGYPHGKGEQEMTSGRIWRGGFKLGERHGAGTLIFTDDTKMTGSYENGSMEGEWVITYPQGQERTVQYENGKMVR